MKKTIAFLSAAILSCAAFISCKEKKAEAASYPARPITMICPWGAGGGTDAVLREICKAAEKQLGQTINVENRTGGSGAIGHSAIKDADPDGYTLGMITFELNSLPNQNKIDYTYEAYDPLIRVNADAAALTVKADAPYNDVQEFVDYCKQNPGTVRIGNSAPASVWHIGAGLFAEKAGISVKHVPFEGAAPAVVALAGGTLDAVAVSLAEVKEQLDAGTVKILGIMDEERPASYPDIRTFREQGFDIVYGTWRGLALPKGVDSSVKQVLADAFSKAEHDPAFVEAAARLNLNLAYLPPDQFADFLKSNYEDVSATMKALGL